MLAKFRRLFSGMDEGDVGTVVFMAQKMPKRKTV
jgi:hypothetical protein